MSTAVTATGEKPLTSAALRELSARSNLPGAVRAVSHYGAIGIFGTLIWLVSSTYGIVWALPLIVVHGYFVAFLFMVVHETAHKTAFRSRALNLVFGHLSSFAIGLPYEYYCLFHWDHHRYTQDPDRDPELLVGRIRALDPGSQAPHCREGSAALCRLLCRAAARLARAPYRAPALGLDRSPDRRP